MTLRTFVSGSFWTLVGLVFVSHVAGGWHFSNQLIEGGFTPDPDPLVTVSGDYELFEVSYQSPLGQMGAWYLPADGTTWVIHVHGKGTTPAEAEPLFAPIQQAGYPQLAITYRNDDQQPMDPSGYYQYGVTEFEDVAGAVDFALLNGAEEIVLNGYSTGAGHVMSFLFRQPDDRIAGIMMDSPNIDLGATVNFRAAQRDLPGIPFQVPPTVSASTKFITSLRIGINWDQVDYIDRVAESINKPVLVHHGVDDLSVPIATSVELAKINPAMIRLIEVEDAGHVESYDVDPEKYVSAVLGFLEQFG